MFPIQRPSTQRGPHLGKFNHVSTKVRGGYTVQTETRGQRPVKLGHVQYKATYDLTHELPAPRKPNIPLVITVHDGSEAHCAAYKKENN